MRTVIHFIDGQAMGGAERVVLQLIEGLDRRVWRPVLFHHRSAGLAPVLAQARQLHVETRALPRMETVKDLSRLPEWVRTIRDERPDVLHAHLLWPLSCKYGLLASALAGVPAVVATAHLFMDVSSKPVVRIQPRVIAWTVDRYLAVSECVARQLRHSFRIPSRKIEVVRNGINLARFHAGPDAGVRASLTGGDDRPVVLTVARLEAQKGLHDLIDAARQVPHALFVVAGDGPERSRLEAQARSEGVGDRVRFLGHRDDIPELLACADVFVMPSLYEGLPLAVMEAMAAGTPVIATAIGGTDELIVDGETGVLVPPANPSALAAAIRMLLDDPEHAKALACAAQRLAHQEFGCARVVQRVGEVYEELLSR
jgi:glycosyltransferase involved in cell wall biosynthesis